MHKNLSLSVFIKQIVKRKTVVLLAGIILISIVLRFANYNNRWGLAADQARDVLVAREALRLHTLPLSGPFSASGPYVFGPYWYWLLMIPIALFPHSLLAPWIFLTSLFVCSVFISFFIGRKLVNEQFGLLLALFFAISPAEILLATNLIMSAFVGFLSVCIFYFFIAYIKDKKLFQLSFLSLIIAIAINTHFEAVPLAAILPVAILFGKRKVKHILFSIVLFLIPFIPLAIFNFQTNSYELTHIFLTNAQPVHRSVIREVLHLIKQEGLFILLTLPKAWERAVVNLQLIFIGDILGIISLAAIAWAFIKKQVTSEMTALFVAGIGIILILGTYGGVIFNNFLAFTRPLVLICIAGTVSGVTSRQKFIGYMMMLTLFTLGMYSDVTTIAQSTNTEITTTKYMEKKLNEYYPNQKFSIYNYLSSNTDKALSLSLVLDIDGRASDTGRKVGYSYIGAPVTDPIIFDAPPSIALRMYDIDVKSSESIKAEGFIPYNPHNVYSSVEEWYSKNIENNR